MSEKQPGPVRDSRGRFVEGVSPNPKGRPKKKTEPPASELSVVLGRILEVTAPDGSRRRVPAKTAVDLRRLKDAMDGKARAISQITKYLINRERWLRKEAEEKAARKRENEDFYAGQILSFQPENATEALQILGIATRDQEYEWSVGVDGYVHLRLEHWAVQLAFRRRRGPEPYSSRDILEITRCTHNPEDLKWPEGSRG